MCGLDRWLAAWRLLGVYDSTPLRALHGNVESGYAESQRHYHTRQHLTECLEQAQEMLPSAAHPSEVELALWFHDAIYDTHRPDNEERSAVWALTAAQSLGVEAEAAQRIRDLILFTGHTVEPLGPDAQIVVDCDLWILGAGARRFDEYEEQVRNEYNWVPDEMFRVKRSAVLNQFLKRDRIYCTALFLERYEQRARENLCRSLEKLGMSA